MTDERNGYAKGLLIGMLAGGVIGALAALLYAPKSGKELRTDIKRKASDIADDAAEYVRTARAKTVEVINEGKHRSDRLVSDAKEKAEHLLGNAEKVLTNIRDRASEEPGRIKSAIRAGVDAYRTEKEQSHHQG